MTKKTEPRKVLEEEIVQQVEFHFIDKVVSATSNEVIILHTLLPMEDGDARFNIVMCRQQARDILFVLEHLLSHDNVSGISLSEVMNEI